MYSSSPETPFCLTGTLNNRPLESLLERVFSLRRIAKLYAGMTPSRDEGEFLQRLFETFNINYQVADAELARIPKTGPLVIVANHPFGCVEGVIMAAMLRQVRPDVKIMANFVLKRIPEVRNLFIAVNPFGGKGATRSNIAPLKEALRWLKQDGLLVVFPAGEVSHLNPFKRAVEDSQWSHTIGRLIQLARVPVQPVYIHGVNSRLFQLAGLMHPLVRTAMLPREFINKANTTIPLRIGTVQPWSRLKGIEDEAALIDYLRVRTYMLRNVAGSQPLAAAPVAPPEESNLIAAVDGELMRREVDALPAAQHLVDSGNMQVYCAYARQIPNTLREIGRLRELSFRLVGEGTGKPLDIDFYDNYYLQLFIWNRDSGEIVGAYRVGEADKIIAKQGVVGLYSHSLFKYSKRLLDELNPALELGRSFVRPEYQKGFVPLMLLWKGIASFVYRNPQYRKLFGPVSISSDYQPLSQKLMVDFLRSSNTFPELARLVKPRSPFKVKSVKVVGMRHSHLTTVEDVSELIAEIESDNKGVPILLRQYLKLGGQVLEFNVDAQFNNSLDALIVLDLLQTEPKILAKYMGKNEVEAFHAWHSVAQTECA